MQQDSSSPKGLKGDRFLEIYQSIISWKHRFGLESPCDTLALTSDSVLHPMVDCAVDNRPHPAPSYVTSDAGVSQQFTASPEMRSILDAHIQIS